MRDRSPPLRHGSRAWTARALAVALAFGCFAPAVSASAAGFQVLTAGKLARFENHGDPARNGGVVVVRRDRALATLHDPMCPATSTVEVEAYLQSTVRTAVLAHVDLDCAKWSKTARGFRYSDPNGTVRSINYARFGLRLEVRGAGFTPISEPVGFLQAQLQIGAQTLRARFHTFRRNDAQVVWSDRPSIPAALGEAGFWDVLLGDDSSEARQQEVLTLLAKAIRHDPFDGRPHFLLAMLHLYRFGQRVVRFDDVSDEARAEMAAANVAFASAVPLLWDDAGERGDSRVFGFASAAKYLQGLIENDDALRAEGLAELERAVEVNEFFNVFDYIPILQALPPGDPVFQQAYASFVTYLAKPETLGCLVTQPEICANAGFAPHNLQGSLTLFGDLYAKAGELEKAQNWYNLLPFFPDTATWKFAALSQDRTANAAARVALYADADPSNDPPVIGAGGEACASCHDR